jgi:hypothetical protein
MQTELASPGSRGTERRDGGGAMGSMANAGERLTTSQPSCQQ